MRTKAFGMFIDILHLKTDGQTTLCHQAHVASYILTIQENAIHLATHGRDHSHPREV